jgi:transcriptional regulatory protein RtcR
VDIVEQETTRLLGSWTVDRDPGADAGDDPLLSVLSKAQIAGLDRFDRSQLTDVVRVCLSSRSLSEAGRELFAASRASRAKINDADRLRKYLARFDLSWQSLHGS